VKHMPPVPVIVEKSWGREEIIHNYIYCCKKLVYNRPIASSLHSHTRKHETFVVASGVFEILLPWGVQRMEAGDSVVLPPGTLHRIRCVTPGTIIEASTHDDPTDCIRLLPSET
jgi:mannose-6-phosphate isomerase-like protein (cupin superfamily)